MATEISDAVALALGAKAEELQARLLSLVEANLDGRILQVRSGALKASVAAALAFSGDAVEAEVGSSGVPYAAIQEHGGRTAAHDIEPVKAKALAFAGVGGLVFARRVNHPGSTIPARAPFGSALDALRDEIAGGLKQAVRDTLLSEF